MILGGVLLFAATFCGPVGAQNITEFNLPQTSSFPRGIAAGADGNIWFTESSANRIGRITPAGTVTEFEIPTSASAPQGITAGPDGNIWFVESSGNKIARIGPTGQMSEFPIPTAGAMPQSITRGPDGNLWFTESGSNKVTKSTVDGVMTEYTLPTASSLPQGIVAGPDGNLWVTLYNANKIARVSQSGSVTEFSIPTAGSFPYGITAGPDGALWFTEFVGNKIGRITTEGLITEFSIPTHLSGPFDIAVGRDNNIWFVEAVAGKVARLTPGGVFTEIPVPTSGSQPTGIAAGADGGLWFTENATRKIGRVMPERPGIHVGPIFSSAQTASRSFLRFYNSGTATAGVSVVFADYATSAQVGQWNSTIPVGAMLQFEIADIERELATLSPFTKPQYYSAAILTSSPGVTFQHVLWQSVVGALTNLSTCSAGVGANRTTLTAVHSGLLQDSYPSSIIVNNTGLSVEAVTLGIFDARNNNRLGTYQSSPILSNGRLILPVASIESAIPLMPPAGAFHYNVKAEGRFSGFLEHIVTNRPSSVITDLTAFCAVPVSQ